jgi:hypothetical protein
MIYVTWLLENGEGNEEKKGKSGSITERQR